MALKIGAENKRNVIIAGALFAVVLGLGVNQLFFSGPPTRPAGPAAVPAPMPARQVATTAPRVAGQAGTASGPEAKQLTSANLDPALHLDKLALSESIEYAGIGRNIFTGEAAVPVNIETAAAGARPGPVVPINTGPPPPPQPPAIDLRYFGYSADRAGKREAFLLHGEDIFEAAPGEIVSHRYKVVAVDARSVQVTDLSYNNTQTLQLTAN